MAVIRQRSSAGKIKIKLVDAVTGTPIEKAQLLFRRNDKPTIEY
jgi:hypothetical protein